jgi:hypothetical protein
MVAIAVVILIQTIIESFKESIISLLKNDKIILIYLKNNFEDRIEITKRNSILGMQKK